MMVSKVRYTDKCVCIIYFVAEFPYVIEIYGFSPSLSTRDLLQEFVGYSRSELIIKWVDDTHALGIFACERQGEVE